MKFTCGTIGNKKGSKGNSSKYSLHAFSALLLLFFLFLSSGLALAASPFETARDALVTRLADTLDRDALLALDEAAIQRAMTPEEREALATEYWTFEVNVPVIVTVMRHVEQAVAPYWLDARGFERTEMRVRNESYEYEVWQKEFPAGRVGLGINGFDKHRPHYFVGAGPLNPGDTLDIRPVFPENQAVYDFSEGASIYHDWSELVVIAMPEALRGHKLLPTIRGRARDAHLIQGFRETPFPATETPDQVMLTWSGDPRTTQSVQWRTSVAVSEGRVRYRPKTTAEDAAWNEIEAQREALEDLFILNERKAHRFSATMAGLEAGTEYEYTVGGPDGTAQSGPYTFSTAPSDDAPLTFLFTSDTHNSPVSGELMTGAFDRHPEAAFSIITGDLVGTGQYRDDWDRFFTYNADYLPKRPLLPSIGNHDVIDGLGADLYLSLFTLPENGAPDIEPQRSYTLRYGNTLIICLDACSSIEAQTPWLRKVLEETDATWKFAGFHFPPYAPVREYPDIEREWLPLFEEYHVDFVLSGHVHRHLRTHPLRGGQVMNSPAEGVIYLITVGVPGRPRGTERSKLAAAADTSGAPHYIRFAIDGKRLHAQTINADGRVLDEFHIEK